MKKFNDLRIHFDATSGMFQVYDEEGEKKAAKLSMEMDLKGGGAIIFIDSKMYEAKEVYLNAREVMHGTGSNSREGAGEDPALGDIS